MSLEVLDIILLTLLFGLLRAIQGNGSIARWMEIAMMTLFLSVFNDLKILQIGLSAIGLYIGFAPGWGKYFSATGMQPFNREEKEIFLIDAIVNKIKYDTMAGIIGMSLRWFIFFMPLFIALNGWYYALPLLLVGPIYNLYRFHKLWSVNEFLSGALLGFSLALTSL